MTESQWLASTDPQAMLAWATGDGIKHIPPQPTKDGRIVSDRKLRLFACAWWRSVLPHDREQELLVRGVEQHGKYIDPDTEEEWTSDLLLRECCDFRGINTRNGADLLRDVLGNPFRPVEKYDWHGTIRKPGTFNVRWLIPQVIDLAQTAYDERERRCRCLKPSRAGGYISTDLDCSVCHGTGHIDDGTLDPVRLAILADALEEAGVPTMERCPECNDESEYRIYCKHCEGSGCAGQVRNPLLAHLRSKSPHVRGCWVIDLLTNRS